MHVASDSHRQVFAAVARAHPGLEGHVFRNPVDPASCMAMICFKNGALARQRVRDLSLPWSHPVAGTRLRDIGGAAGSSKTGGSGAGSATDGIATSTGAVNGAPSWKAFDRALSAESAPGNGGRLALFYFEPEITPTLNRAVIAHARTHFAGAGAAAVAAAEHATPAVLDEASLRVQPASEAVAAICCSGELQSSQGSQGSQSAGADNAWSAAAECRAIVESQALAMRVHSRRLGLEQPSTEHYASLLFVRARILHTRTCFFL